MVEKTFWGYDQISIPSVSFRGHGHIMAVDHHHLHYSKACHHADDVSEDILACELPVEVTAFVKMVLVVAESLEDATTATIRFVSGQA